ncbi:MAG: DEAD/DEAH box helicase [Deltaproteobacteria bacterium]
MQLIATVQGYAEDLATQNTWERLAPLIKDVEGIAFYQHPIIRSGGDVAPDLAILGHGYEPLAVRCLPYRIEDIAQVTDEHWVVGGETIDSPFLQVDDFVQALHARFQASRKLRGAISPMGAVSLPGISHHEYVARFPQPDTAVLWREGNAAELLRPNATTGSSPEAWRLAQSIFQTLQQRPKSSPSPGQIPAATIGEAIGHLEREIALLDDRQLAVATQLPAGPQRIRGLAGTGKTVLLAMKAANLHLRFPSKRILVTFHTQSLYNQTTRLIEQFFKNSADATPDWSMLRVRHSWGGRDKPGVYSELSQAQGVVPLNFRTAAARNRGSPFSACCEEALSRPIQSTYDFILVDEAQDFPPSFFQVLYRLSAEPHAIYWAYDELQNLSSIDMPGLGELFGRDGNGQPLVSLDGTYPGEIEKDLVLKKSYRCPHETLMLAHAIGLGLYSTKGCVQMLANAESWRSVGYEIESGPLAAGNQVVLTRPPENSPNPITRLYNGPQKLTTLRAFANRAEEVEWVAQAITDDLSNQGLLPEQVLVVSLDTQNAKSDLGALQRSLYKTNIQSIIPGLVDGSSEFAEPGMVTLATIYRAKGNEAPVVYVLAVEQISTYVHEIDARNRAFTAISRAKGFVRITGSGPLMSLVESEVSAILDDIPLFRFTFPDMSKIRNLDAETSRRRSEFKKAKRSVEELMSVDPGALHELSPEDLLTLERKIREARGEGK